MESDGYKNKYTEKAAESGRELVFEGDDNLIMSPLTMHHSEKRLYRYTTRLEKKCGFNKMRERWEYVSDSLSDKNVYRMCFCIYENCFKMANLTFLLGKICR